MRRVLLVLLAIVLLAMTSCTSATKTNNESIETQKSNIKTFACPINSLLESIKHAGFDYEQTNEIDYGTGEKNTFGVLYINSEDKLDRISLQIRNADGNVFQVIATYTITDSSPIDTADKLLILYKTILSNIRPDLPDDTLSSLNKESNEYYSRDFDNLRITIDYKDESHVDLNSTVNNPVTINAVRVEAYFVMLDWK